MTEPPTPDPDRPVYLGGPPGVGIAVPAHVAGQLGLLPDDLTPAALEDARTAARAELERLELATVQHRADALERARLYSAHVRTQSAELDAAVAEARATGATWQQIANAVGITRQSAWARWNDGANR